MKQSQYQYRINLSFNNLIKNLQVRKNLQIKLWGGILLIAGTSIGAGMLGLPIATAQAGFLNSSLLFIFCWILMTFTALLTLEVNLCFPKNWNVISIAKATLGKPGELISWTIYLLFLYSLVSAYIAGGRDILYGLLITIGIKVPISLCGGLFIFLFSSIVIFGIKSVEIFNRFIMVFKLSLIFLLIFYLSPYVNSDNYFQQNIKLLLPSISVAITSFGFSIIIPSLRNYFEDNIKKLRLTILTGSFLSLLCYIGWNAVILGTIPLNGEYALSQLRNAEQPISELLESISYYTQAKKTALLLKIFVSISTLTSFVCVSLALFDYLADGFQTNRAERKKWIIILATFTPPFLITTFYPKAFILFLSLAGLFCMTLQGLMPAIMVWNCRYLKKIPTAYEVWGNKFTLSTSIFVSILIIFITIYEIIS